MWWISVRWSTWYIVLCQLSFSSYSSALVTDSHQKYRPSAVTWKWPREKLSWSESLWSLIPLFQVLGFTGGEIWILPFSRVNFNDPKWVSSFIILKSIQKMGFEKVWGFLCSGFRVFFLVCFLFSSFLSPQIQFRVWKIQYAL